MNVERLAKLESELRGLSDTERAQFNTRYWRNCAVGLAVRIWPTQLRFLSGQPWLVGTGLTMFPAVAKFFDIPKWTALGLFGQKPYTAEEVADRIHAFLRRGRWALARDRVKILLGW